MFAKISNWNKERKLKEYRAFLAQVNDLEGGVTALTDDALRARFDEFRAQVAGGADAEDLLPAVFAAIREAAKRTLRVRPYDVQVMGGLVLCNNAIAQMATGEGKTITAAFAVFVQHLRGLPVHVCTANEYLAQRDANSLLRLYQFMGLRVGVVLQSHSLAQKRVVYGCDVTYGTHQSFAQDYLSDNLTRQQSDVVQVRGRGFVLVDEADSVLIDDSRTPVVMSATQPANAALYTTLADWAQKLVRAATKDGEGDFWIDGQDRQAVLTDSGYDRVNAMLVEAGLLSSDEEALYGAEHQQLVHRLTAALAARHILHRDQHYVVVNGEIVLVDEMTGRLMPGRRWDAGLQQALEAKESLPISPENIVLARLTLQNYFKLYKRMSGMTGTATTEAEELGETYGLDVVEIPTNKPSIRVDEPDRFYRTQAAKMAAVVEDAAARHAKGQPVLIGTASIEQSEQLSALLAEKGLAHEVLNARHHEREADIIAEAGVFGAITVSTNMAGRGVDIVLGGSPDAELRRRWAAMGEEAWDALSAEEQKALVEGIRADCAANAEKVRAVGGLHIMGMERYESRRMDRQLRGRSGRQGDPGSTCFYISFEDPLVENFAGERIRGILAQLDIKAGDELESKLVRKAVDAAQRQVEGRAVTARQQLMKYDEVLNAQRSVFYAQREEMLASTDFHAWLSSLRDRQADMLCAEFAPAKALSEEWNLKGLAKELARFGVTFVPDEACLDLEADELQARIKALMAEQHAATAAQVPVESLANAERFVVLAAMDHHWFAHLEELDQLRKGIHLRAHAKEDPQQAYKKEAFRMFEHMLDAIRVEMVTMALTWRLAEDEPSTSAEEAPAAPTEAQAEAATVAPAQSE